MKIIIAVALLIAGAFALPQTEVSRTLTTKESRIVTDAIASAIEDVSQSIKDLGLDPLDIASLEGVYALPVPTIFRAEGVVEDLLFQGLSDIVINNLSFNILTNRLTFDLELPSVSLNLGRADVVATLFGEELKASASGSFAIRRVRVAGNVRVNISVISGISIRSLEIALSVQSIESALNVAVLDRDLSEQINTFANDTVPHVLDVYGADINELLGIILLDIINNQLNPSQ